MQWHVVFFFIMNHPLLMEKINVATNSSNWNSKHFISLVGTIDVDDFAEFMNLFSDAFYFGGRFLRSIASDRYVKGVCFAKVV